MSKKILVLGGTSGLGRKLAELYHHQGEKVGVIGRRTQLLDEIRTSFPGIETVQADISNPSIEERLKELVSLLNGMDIFILTASTGEFNDSLEEEIELRTLAINVEGFTRAINFAWHYFKEHGGGQIVGVTSIAAVRGNKVAPAYNASKAFQSSYLEGIRIKAQHEKNNIAVTELMPGFMDTKMGMGERMFWVSKVDKAARQSVSAIRHKKRRAYISKRWRLIHIILKWMPSSLYRAVSNGSWKINRKS